MPSTSEIAAAIGVSQPRVVQLKKEGMPTNTIKAAKIWRNQQAKKREATNAKSKSANLPPNAPTLRGRPMKVPKPSKTGDSLLDALNNTITVADAAFKAYHYAMTKGLSTQSARLSEHNKAIDGRLRAEKAYREEMERRGILVLKSEITDKCRRGLDAVLRLLNKLPGEQGPQCNPHDPLMAVKILQKKVDEIKAAAQGAMQAL